MTAHNEAKKEDIARVVIMPGDPMRAKYIASKYLDNAKLVNSVRGMYAYTGSYKGKMITVMAHGMGMPSMGIYSYELYKYYDVDTIIRIGSCGGYLEEEKLFDIILSERVYTESNYAYTLNNEKCHLAESDKDLNFKIEKVALEKGIKLFKGTTACLDCFDLYMTDVNKFLDRIPESITPIAAEMEAFALFYIAKMLGKKAACLMSVVDSKFIKENVSASMRERGLDKMIELALDSVI